jgi:hypothetical protein
MVLTSTPLNTPYLYPVLNTRMTCRSLSPTLMNIIILSRFVEYTVMTFGEPKGPNVVTFTFPCNIFAMLTRVREYFISLAIHISFVSIGYSQLIFSRN